MNYIVRGILWHGLYLFMVVLPLVTATLVDAPRTPRPFLVELAVGAGFVGFALMSLEFALISRISAAAQAFGEDSLQLFHNLMGMLALCFILAHPILLIAAGYPASCWLNPLAECANLTTRTAALSLYTLLALIATSIWRVKLRISYEIWYLLHGLFALVVLSSALVHIFVLGRYTTVPVMKAVWILYAVLTVGFVSWFKIWKPIRYWNRKWEVIENRPERGDAHTLILQPVGHRGFTFHPGQFAWLKMGRTPFGLGQHPISISSGAEIPDGGTISFTIKNLGDWSGGTVPALAPGKTMWVDGPHGVFSLDREPAMGYVFVGGGIGFTPLHSMCRTMADRGDVRPVVFFYGARSEDDLTGFEELQTLVDRMNLTLVPVLSNPADDWSGERGYIDVDVMKRHAPQQIQHFKFFICGPKPLMDVMETVLPEVGIPVENILTERFDMV